MDHFQYKNDLLHAEDVNLHTLAETLGTPFYCYSSATLTRHFHVFTEALAPLNPLVCYAVKANPTLAVLATLARLGAGADVVSEGEIRAALAAGMPPQKIVFSGVGKTTAEMAYALEQNILQFNVESEPELLALSAVAKRLGKIAHIAIRVNPDVTPHTHAKISTGQKESKFGIPMSAAEGLYREAMALEGIQVQGVSVHIGSQLTQTAPFAEAFSRVRSFVETLRGRGIPLETIDLGGGLGIPYRGDAPPPPSDYAAIAKDIFSGLNARYIFEPGRLLVGNAGILVTRVIYVKKGEDRTFVILDAGMNDLLRPTLYDAYHEIIPVAAAPKNARTTAVDVVGPVCETGDIFAEARPMVLPKAGDLVAFRSAGAYGASMASTYNSRPLIAEVMVKGAAFSLIRPRQSYADLIARDALPKWM